MNLNDWAKEIHKNAVDHGWWDDEPEFPTIIALCHSELSEALEEYRNRQPNFSILRGDVPAKDDGKPVGVAVEMADCLIRILDWFGGEGVDVEFVLQAKHDFNRTREYRHGGKRV